MKSLNTVISILLLAFSCHTVHAQESLKIGHLNTATILQSMPENDSAQILLEKDRTELANMLEQMESEYNRVINDYSENLATYSEMIRASKESEIMDLQDKITAFQQNASLQLQQRNMELFQPVYDKLQKAIDAVALRNQFTYIFDVSQGMVVYLSAKSQSIDSLVIRELGLR